MRVKEAKNIADLLKCDSFERKNQRQNVPENLMAGPITNSVQAIISGQEKGAVDKQVLKYGISGTEAIMKIHKLYFFLANLLLTASMF